MVVTTTRVDRNAVALNRDQERIVRYLAEEVRRELSGETTRVIERAWPHRKLQLGVLPPLPPPEDEASETEDAPESAVEQIQTERHAPTRAEPGRPPSTMAIEFDLLAEHGQVSLDVKACFSVYVQRYPSREQQRGFWATAAGQSEPNVGADGENRAGGVPDDASGRPKLVRSMPLMHVFERIDITTGSLRVALDPARHFSSEDLRSQVQAAIDRVLVPELTKRETVHPFSTGTQTLPEDALVSDEAWWSAILQAEGDVRRLRPLGAHRATVLVNHRRDRVGKLRVRVTLANESVAPRRRGRGADGRELGRDMHLFNCSVEARRLDGHFSQIEFALAPEDFRYDHLRRVWGHGSNAVAEGVDTRGDPIELDEEPAAIRTTTWPVFRQRALRTNPAYEVAFAELAGPRWREQLSEVERGMEAFLAEWDAELEKPEWEGERRDECRRAREEFAEEVRRYRLGLRALDEDERLARAFREANRVFIRTGARKGIASWRLFQLVYQVIHLAALRAREVDDAEFVSELDTADVLWFPTGGGKTEAYLGLIAVALFYDRLRGKTLGLTAILRFPLRMLSVQQLSRVGTVVYVAEELRAEIDTTEGLMSGDPFALGFYVGMSNCPNRLTGPKGWQEESILWWAEFLAKRPEDGLVKRVITECLNPDCEGGDVRLEADVDAVRLRHVCSRCGDLRVYFTDEEVFRYLPAVTVCTVDKLASVGRDPHVSQFISGPTRRCPDHGYFTHLQARFEGGRFQANDRCLGGSYCRRRKSEYETIPPEAVKDPVPALQVQDEMHLLQEELGAFDAHYETLYEHLQRATVRDTAGMPIGKPTKLLAATATIERYEEQVRNLYARRAKVFPAPGWALDRSFYTTLSEDARRLYVGSLPMLRDAAEFGGRVQGILHARIEALQDDPGAALELLRLESIHDEQKLLEELFLYELSLGYVNRSRDGDVIQNELGDFARDFGGDSLRTQLLASDAVTLTEIADTLHLIDDQGLSTPRPQRLRGLVGTSLVSHGVDINRLNLMVVNWMPAKIADYIQATSRAGRTHVGLVIVGYDRINLRDTSHFHYFLPHHRFIERLVAPVPVNRFAKFAIERTLPGLITAIILQGYGRSPARQLLYRSEFVRWWNEQDPERLEADLIERVLDSLGLAKTLLEPDGERSLVFDQGMVDSLRADVKRELPALLADLKTPTAGKLTEMLTPRPLTSFRDVDEPLLFSTLGRSSDAMQKLTTLGEGR